MNIHELPTPTALVDLDTLERNTAAMARRASELGVELRPHVKTHKCVAAARLQVRGHRGAITVSTLAEAHHFAAAGFRDITWALPLPPGRIAEVARLSAELDHFHVLLDDRAALEALESHARGCDVHFSAFLEVDCGDHRSGVDPADPAAHALARALARSPAVEFAGLLTHAGHAYACRGPAEVVAVAEQERDVLLGFAEELRAEGLEVRALSVGSTPTLRAARDLGGITEARPGNYAFFDAYQVAIGSCEVVDAALTVLATVVGCYPARDALVLDAGALALSKDPGPRHVDPDCGFGRLRSLDLQQEHSELALHALSQEHGHVRCRVAGAAARFPVGTRVRILPNHSCLTAALFERYHIVRGGEVIDEWHPARGW